MVAMVVIASSRYGGPVSAGTCGSTVKVYRLIPVGVDRSGGRAG